MVAIFTYGFAVAEKNFNDEHCMLYTLADYETLLREAVESNYIQQTELASLQQWRRAPDQWTK
jgi:orotate phosphoribosyltransferase